MSALIITVNTLDSYTKIHDEMHKLCRIRHFAHPIFIKGLALSFPYIRKLYFHDQQEAFLITKKAIEIKVKYAPYYCKIEYWG